jgi:predicted ATPase
MNPDIRLVTLLGAPGIGKTRLSIESARQSLADLPDGVFFVALAPLDDPSQIPSAILQTLGYAEKSDLSADERIMQSLGNKRLLLVLDNCEHLIEDVASLGYALLSACPHLKILTTSREALRVPGEWLYFVSPLNLPETNSSMDLEHVSRFSALTLFAERARAVRPDFALSTDNIQSVVTICSQLDGLPLAIELIAARIRFMSPHVLLSQLSNQFVLYADGMRAVSAGHKTLHNAIDWSYKLLSEQEQSLLARLSVFVGGFTPEAAEAVAVGGELSSSQVPDLLGQLINKSLVTMEASPAGNHVDTRHGMLETIHEYAREKLGERGETEQLRWRHRDYFIALAEQAEPKLKGADQFEWIDRLELEHDNLRAAWNCAIKTDATLALRLTAALFWLWVIQGDQREGRTWLSTLIEASSQWGESTRHAHMLGMAGWLANYEHDSGTARQLLEGALASARRSGDKKEIAFALLGLGHAYRQQGDPRHEPFLGEALTIYQELQDQWNVAWALVESTSFAAADAEQRFLQSLAIFQELGDKLMMGGVLTGLGELMRLRGDYERAGKFYEQELEILRGSHIAASEPMSKLAWVSLHRGDPHKAQALFEEVLSLYQEDGDTNGLINCIAGFAAVLAMRGKPEQAARLFGAAQSSLEALGKAGYLDPPDQKEFDHYLTIARGQLDHATFAKAWEEGRAMAMEQAMVYAREETAHVTDPRTRKNAP